MAEEKPKLIDPEHGKVNDHIRLDTGGICKHDAMAKKV